MNILVPDSWLREYLDTTATPKQLKDCLSLCGPSIERINTVGNDTVYDIEITSNRVDMASVFGIAREAAVILPRFGIKATLKPVILVTPTLSEASRISPKRDSGQARMTNENLPLAIEDSEHLCDRLLAVVMDGVTIGQSTELIKSRVEKSGVRALNNVIDITNYIMLALGHPTHVFDYDRIQTKTLILRNAKKGEKLLTLDQKVCTLIPTDVVIDDGTGRIIDLPGIMGTENSVVTNDTKRIVFFTESNNPTNIRKTSMRLGLRSMAATINEKHPDPETAYKTFLFGLELFQKLTGAKIAGKIIDIYPKKSNPIQISVSTDFINNRLGVVLTVNEIETILKNLGFSIVLKDETFVVTPPTYRQFEITIPEDIVEEVARIYGYHNLPSILMTGEIPVTKKPKDLPVEEMIKKILKYWGFTETYHYSFVSKKLLEKTGLNPSEHVRIANPLTTETEYMRTTLLPTLIDTIANNQFLKPSLSLFELAKVYLPRNGDLPDEQSLLVLATHEGFLKLKGLVESLLNEIGISPTKFVGGGSEFFHPKQSGAFKKDYQLLAQVGLLHPKLQSTFQLKAPLYIAEIPLSALIPMLSPVKKFTTIPLYPPAREDLSLTVPKNLKLGELIEVIKSTDKLVTLVELIEQYKNTVHLRITYQDPTKNLDANTLQHLREKILKTLKEKINAELKMK